MDGFDLRTFGGISPRTSRRLLRDTMATHAHDIYLLHGNAAPARLPLATDTMLSLADAKSIYRHCERWLAYPNKVYFSKRVLPNDAGERLYIFGDGSPKIRDCNGKTYPLGINKPSTALITKTVNADFSAYTYRFFGFYEGSDGSIYDKTAISPTIISAGKEYTFAPFARIGAPEKSEFGISVEVSKGNLLLGVAYSSNTYRSGNSDLYINASQVIASLFVRNNGVDSAYDDGAINPSLLVAKLTYKPTDNASITRSYVYTYVTAWGEESQPSDPSALLTVDAGNNVTVSGFTESNHANVNRIRLYRTDTTGQFRFIAELPATTTTYTDSLLDTELAEVLPSTTWQPPPENLKGAVGMPNGFMAGFEGNMLWFSEVNQPHAWPAEYTLTKIDGDIVGISGAFENSLVVITNKHPYIVTGYAPDAMSATKVSAYEPCLSEFSIVDMGIYGVGYATANGFVVVRGGSAEVFTEPFITPEQWRDYLPATMRCAWHKERLHVVSDNIHLCFSMREGDDILTTETSRPSALWFDSETDNLYIHEATRLFQYSKGDYSSFKWISGETQYQRPASFVRAKIEAEHHPVTLLLYANGAEVYRRNTVNNEPFFLPVLPRSKHWMIGIESQYEVHRVVVTNGHIEL